MSRWMGGGAMALAALLAASGSAGAQDIVVNGSGAGFTASAATQAAVLLGQPAVGTAAADTTAAALGFWAGYRYRDTVPVGLVAFTLTWEGSSVVLTWEAAGALDRAGFHVYRAVDGKERVRVTDRLLAGGPRFRFSDPSPPPGEVAYWLADVSRTGDVSWHGPLRVSVAGPRPRLALLQNFPNPATGSTTIGFQVPADGPVRLRVHDLEGRLVAVLVDATTPAGVYEAVWDGRTGQGRRAAAGVYFYRLETREGIRIRRLILLD